MQEGSTLSSVTWFPKELEAESEIGGFWEAFQLTQLDQSPNRSGRLRAPKLEAHMYKFLKQICSCSRSLSDHQLEYNRSTEMSSESQGIPALVAHAAGRINPPPPQRSISPYANGFMSSTTGGSSTRRRCNHVFPITSDEEMEPTTAPVLQATRIIRTWERWVTVWSVHFVIDNHFFVAAELMMFCDCRTAFVGLW